MRQIFVRAASATASLTPEFQLHIIWTHILILGWDEDFCTVILILNFKRE